MYCKVILIGHVGAEPTIRTLESGVKTASVRMATTERFADKTGTTVEHTEWHSVTLWRGLAEVVDKYVHKGSQLFIEGRIRTREWTDKEGVKRYATDIIADAMKLLGTKRDAQNAQNSCATPPASSTVPVAPDPDYDRLPF